MFYSRFRVRIRKRGGVFSRTKVRVNGVECSVVGFSDGVVELRTWMRVKWSEAARDHLRVYFWFLKENFEILDCELVEVK